MWSLSVFTHMIYMFYNPWSVHLYPCTSLSEGMRGRYDSTVPYDWLPCASYFFHNFHRFTSIHAENKPIQRSLNITDIINFLTFVMDEERAGNTDTWIWPHETKNVLPYKWSHCPLVSPHLFWCTHNPPSSDGSCDGSTLPAGQRLICSQQNISFDLPHKKGSRNILWPAILVKFTLPKTALFGLVKMRQNYQNMQNSTEVTFGSSRSGVWECNAVRVMLKVKYDVVNIVLVMLHE